MQELVIPQKEGAMLKRRWWDGPNLRMWRWLTELGQESRPFAFFGVAPLTGKANADGSRTLGLDLEGFGRATCKNL
jgi:hypothetical protein